MKISILIPINHHHGLSCILDLGTWIYREEERGERMEMASIAYEEGRRGRNQGRGLGGKQRECVSG